ncbi:MAG: endonuclease/exonuclease/phosphatase family protein [Clostridia bacterium]|nr:endonuclease/exonuclease/phosphatase family protein [Clostridia bacterium]
MSAILRISAAAAALLLCTMLSACGTPDTPNTDTTAPDTTAPTVTTEAPRTVIASGGASDFVLYRPKSLGTESLAAVDRLTAAFRTEAGVNLKVVTDWGDAAERADAAEKAILIGRTSFAESDALRDLRMTQYTVVLDGSRLVIGGLDDATTARAIDAFIEGFVKGKGGTVAFGAEDTLFHTGKYQSESALTLLGQPIGRAEIVIPAGSPVGPLRAAAYIRNHISTVSGYQLDIVTADAAGDGPYIKVEQDEGGHTYQISANADGLLVKAGSPYAIEAAIDAFCDNVKATTAINAAFSLSGDVTGELAKASPSLGNRAGDLRFMVHNVWGAGQGDDPENDTTQRNQMMAEIFAGYAPDVLGLQECSGASRKGKVNSIVTLLANYGYVEIIAENQPSNAVNYTPLFYNPETVKVIESGFYLYRAGNDETKSITWAVFESLASGKRFAACSTHHAYQKSTEGNALREAHVAELLTLVADVTARHNCPFIFGGDFNTRMNTVAYQRLDEVGVDAQVESPITDDNRTTHAYPVLDEKLGVWADAVVPTETRANAIDHIFTAGDGITHKQFDIVTDLWTLLSSDHCPLVFDFTLN